MKKLAAYFVRRGERNVEKIGKRIRVWGASAPTNRRLFGQKVLWLWQKPFEILAERERCSDLLGILKTVQNYYRGIKV